MREKTKNSKRIKVNSRDFQGMRKNMREFGKNSREYEKFESLETIREGSEKIRENTKESGRLPLNPWRSARMRKTPKEAERIRK